MKKINTLVIGQGLAGSLVAYMLHQHKIPFAVIDPAYANTSSRIAAGMFTPISGKRKTIHPIVLQQIPFAIQVYREIEQLLGTTILHQQNIYEVHNGVAGQKEVAAKSAMAEYDQLILNNPNTLPNLKLDWGACEITHSGWVDCELLINGFAQWLKQKEALIIATFVYEDLRVCKEGMEYQGMEFEHIIFCEGYRAINNPFFKSEKIIPCKGDVLTIKYDQPATDRIIKNDGIYLISTGNHIGKAGSTYQWNNNSELPEEAGKKLIEGKLGAMLENQFTTIDHKAAIRPTTQNREVISRQHPGYAGMFMLNGLGTKGVLQGPWWARQVVQLCLGSAKV